MDKLFVAKTTTSRGSVEYEVSQSKTKEDAEDQWEECGVQVVKIIEIKTRESHVVAIALIRALASTPAGADFLSTFLTQLVKHETL
jgi:hypothetical protein